MLRTHRHQHTLARSTEVTGFGYWSGQDIRVQFRPAPANHGIVFVRGDCDPPVQIPVAVKNRVEIPRRTSLTAGGARVEMVEHILASLAGLQIDNCEIWVDAVEMPGMDGSSLPFVEALQQAGLVEQPAMKAFLVVNDITRVGDDDMWIEARPSPRFGMTVQYRLDYGSNHPIGRETLKMEITPEGFLSQLAPARTFIMRQEADWLREQGLASRVSTRDILVFDDDGVMDNELRFENECVAHKVLDLVGDLSLAGCDLIGHFIAYRSGHRLNAELVAALLAEHQVVRDSRATA